MAPRMRLGLPWKMRLSAIDEAPGCSKITRPSDATLKLDQLKMARSVCCCTRSTLPVCVAVPRPEVTKPATFGPHTPDTQATGMVGSAVCAPAIPVRPPSTADPIKLDVLRIAHQLERIMKRKRESPGSVRPLFTSGYAQVTEAAT